MKKRVLSGTRATGRLHLGNYLGAVKGMLALQDDPAFETLYMVADLHSINSPYDTKTFQESVRGVVLDYLSAGLDPEKSSIFIQSQIPEHTELFYLLSTTVTIARMQHLPTFKEKVKQYPDSATMALLNYPVLMASDILLYKADLVPTGIDQEPHIEVAREVARKMNERFGTKFPEPRRHMTEGEYVPSLTGEGKMSKSVEGSFINLGDDLEAIKKKLASVPTDSGKGEKVPVEGGVPVLLKLIELFMGSEKKKEFEKSYIGSGVRYSDLKNDLAQAIFKDLAPIQEKRKELESSPAFVKKVISEGVEKAGEIAKETIREVKEKMGLV